MAHAREQIRDAVVIALTGLTTTGSRVYASRVYPMSEDNMPGIIVYTKTEISSPATLTIPRRIERNLNIMIDAYAKRLNDYDDTVDKICSEVESAIYSNAALKTLVKDIFIAETEIKLSGEAEKPVSIASLTLACRYYTPENNPETLI